MSQKKHHLAITGETKSVVAWRNIVSFLLFVSIAVLSVASCGKAYFLNQQKMANALINKEYVQSIYDDAKQFAYDMCNECSIPTDSVEQSLSFDVVYDVNEAYVFGNLGHNEAYNKSTYETRLNAFNQALNDSTNQMLEENGNTNIDTESVNKFSTKIADYLEQIVEIKALSKLQNVTNVGKIALVVLIAILSIISVILILICLLISKKKYRGLRAISYSFISASLLNLCVVIGAEIIKKIKTLYFFPTYLCKAAMNFVNNSIFAFLCCAIVLLAISFVIIVIGWRLKRDDK